MAWLALSLGASPGGLAAGPQPASPQGLPPSSVDQGGLWWGLNTIGTQGASKPFRFSLCEGRYLEPGEVSRPCDPSRARTVAFGHDAPFVFSPGHNTFLPPGLSIDGNGILKGDDPELLANLDIPMCVRQLHVEQCRTIQLRNNSSQVLVEQRPVAVAIESAPAPRKGGSGTRALALVLGLGAAAVAVGAASQLATVEDTSTSDGCPSYNDICGGGASGACGVPSSCGCAGARDMGIVTQNVANATRGMCTVGNRNCSCQ